MIKERSALILYGSETGNAFDYAQELGQMTERLHFWTHVSDLDAVEPVRDANIEHGFLLILIS